MNIKCFQFNRNKLFKDKKHFVASFYMSNKLVFTYFVCIRWTSRDQLFVFLTVRPIVLWLSLELPTKNNYKCIQYTIYATCDNETINEGVPVYTVYKKIHFIILLKFTVQSYLFLWSYNNHKSFKSTEHDRIKNIFKKNKICLNKVRSSVLTFPK